MRRLGATVTRPRRVSTRRSRPKPLMHLQFQEAVASGLAILAYHHWLGRREDEKLLLGYDPL